MQDLRTTGILRKDANRMVVIILRAPRADRDTVDFPTRLASRNFLARMQDTQHARKLDSSGRLVIPARLREELGLQVGDLCQFYLHQENGKRYLCIEVENEIERAKRMLEANGYQVSGLSAGAPSPNFE